MRTLYCIVVVTTTTTTINKWMCVFRPSISDSSFNKTSVCVCVCVCYNTHTHAYIHTHSLFCSQFYVLGTFEACLKGSQHTPIIWVHSFIYISCGQQEPRLWSDKWWWMCVIYIYIYIYIWHKHINIYTYTIGAARYNKHAWWVMIMITTIVIIIIIIIVVVVVVVLIITHSLIYNIYIRWVPGWSCQ